MNEERDQIIEDLALLERLGVHHTQAQDMWVRAAELHIPVNSWSLAKNPARLIGYDPTNPSPFHVTYGGLKTHVRTGFIGDLT